MFTAREQMVTMLYGFAEYIGADISVDENINIVGYKDADKISGWADKPMKWAIANGIIIGTGEDELSPKADSNRAQIAAVVQRFFENVVNK